MIFIAQVFLIFFLSLCDKSAETIFQNSLDDEKKVDTKFALPSFDNLGGKYLS